MDDTARLRRHANCALEEGLREAIGAPLSPVDRAGHDRSVAAVRTALGEAAFAAAWAAGRALSLEEATVYALEESDEA